MGENNIYPENQCDAECLVCNNKFPIAPCGLECFECGNKDETKIKIEMVKKGEKEVPKSFLKFPRTRWCQKTADYFFLNNISDK